MICSYPLSSVGMLLSANELGLKPKMIGGAMVGLQATVIKDKLKGKLNGVVNYDNWVPSAKMMAPAADFFKKYQARAPGHGVDPLGYYLGGWGYAYLQVLAAGGRRHQEHQRRQDRRLPAQQRRQHASWRKASSSAKTASGSKPISSRCSITTSPMRANLETWRGMSYQTVLKPDDEKTGDVIYPYANAVKA